MNVLTDIAQSTIVAFPNGNTKGNSIIRYVAPYETNKTLVIIDETPFHPLSNSWPDQEADIGTVAIEGNSYAVIDSLTAAVNPQESIRLYIDT
jgi:alanyl-tRNA synthetase